MAILGFWLLAGALSGVWGFLHGQGDYANLLGSLFMGGFRVDVL